MTKSNYNYRILTEDYKIKFAGTGKDSWFTLEDAQILVNYSAGEMIYEYTPDGDRLHEVL